MTESRLLVAAIVVTLLSLAADSWLGKQDPLSPVSAPATEFSGERALQLLQHLLQDETPHPVGSAQNRRVKRRIQAWLDERGIAHEEQQAWACSQRSTSCSLVENIIARLPGQLDGPHVALMAHYDSVPHSPGAGDDMAGVAAVLETARALKAGANHRYPLLLLITDSEETGLHGAEAFFQRHPLASDVGVLLNVEGSGTRGQSIVLRTSMDNGWFMRRFREDAAQPAGSSLANEVFRRMPNDTDFSVAMDARVPGIDFSFAGERNHYHTPNDSLANLDPRTIQHHGDNLFPLALDLANADLEAAHAGSVVYQSVFGTWLQWPRWATWVLLLLSGAALMAASVRAGAGPVEWATNIFLLPALVLAAGGGLVHLCFYLLESWLGTLVSWPAHLWAFRLVVFAGVLLPALLLACWPISRRPFLPLLLGAWWLLWLLTVALSLYMPDAAAPFVVVLVPASLWLALVRWLPLGESSRAWLSLAVLCPASLFLSNALLLEQTQGFRLFPALWPLVGLYALIAIAFARGRWLGAVTWATAIALAVGFISAASLPLYSEWRPQHLNVWHVQDADENESVAYLWPGGDLPDAVAQAADFAADVTGVMPWTDTALDYAANVAVADLEPPELRVEDETLTAEGRTIRLRLSSNRRASQLRLYLPASARPWRGEIDGSPVEPAAVAPGDSRQFDRLLIHGVQDGDVVLTLSLGTRETVKAWLADLSPSLPQETAAIAVARDKSAVPVHTGDASMIYREVNL